MEEKKERILISQKTLRDFYYIVFRHKRIITIFFVIIVATVILGSFLMPKVFRSEAKLMVRIGRESVTLDPVASYGKGKFVNIDRDPSGEINSELEIITSQEIAEAVVDLLGVDTLHSGMNEQASFVERFTNLVRKVIKLPITLFSKLVDFIRYVGVPDEVRKISERDSAVRALMKSLKAEVMVSSNIVHLSYDDKSPALACGILSKLIDVYMSKHIDVHRTEGSFEFFTQQKKDFNQALQDIEDKIRSFKNRTGFASLEEQRTILLQRIGTLKEETEKVESDMTASAAKIKSLKQTLAALPKELLQEETRGMPASAEDELRKSLHGLRLKEQELLSTFTEESVPVVEIRNQIREAEKMLSTEEDKQIKMGINVSHQQIELDLFTEKTLYSSLQAKIKTLHDQIDKSQKELTSLNDIEGQINQLEREKKILESNYQNYSESLEQARIDHELSTYNISNISIVQPATMPVKHIRPRKTLNLILGIFIGIFGSIVLAYFVDYMDHTFKKPEDIESRLGIPSLTVIPYFDDGIVIQPSTITVKNLIQIPEPSNEALQRAFEGKNVSADVQKHFEYLLHSVILSEQQKEGSSPHIIAVTSCRAGDGVSTVASNLAVNLARVGQGRILLVDMNLVKMDKEGRESRTYPNMGNIIALSKGKMAGVLPPMKFDQMYMLQHSGYGNATQVADLQNIWNDEYSFVVIDLPTVFDEAGVATIAKLADQVILVIEAEGVRWEVAQRGKEKLIKTGANLIGAVLNKRRFYVPEWLYQRLT